jgi:hypothetical protein
MTAATPFYEAVAWELRKQMLRLSLTFEQADELSGLEQGYAAKMLNPATPTGRQAGWVRIQYLMDVVYAGGFILTIRPRADQWRIRAELERKLEKRGRVLNPLSIADSARLRGVAGKVPIRDYSSFAGTKGGVRRREMPPKKRSRLARKAAKIRWHKPRITQIK